MKIKGKKHRGSLLMVLLALGALLPACGTDSPTGQVTQTGSGFVSTNSATAGLKTCTSCHPTETADWMLSKHANVEPLGNLDSKGLPDTGYFFDPNPAVNCKPCHDQLGDSGQLIAGYTGNTARPVIGCESCHGGGSLHVAKGGVGFISRLDSVSSITTLGTVTVSQQFQTCTACHLLLKSDGTPTSGNVHGAFGNAGEIITDTHLATAGFWPGSPFTKNLSNIAGWAMDYNNPKVCTDCHNPHGTADRNREWQQSNHAALSKSGAWAVYNWSLGAWTDCQRCHTTTGYAAYADALRTGNTALARTIADGSTPPLAPDANFKPQMIECWGCHTDNRGTLRFTGVYTADYSSHTTSFTVSESSHVYPDISSSNVCLPCHTGEQNGDTIKNLSLTTDPTVTTFGNLAFIDPHNLAAAGTVFTAIGYEYFGRSYANPASYKHDKIGTAAAPGTGNKGPCVGCHMYRSNGPANHVFKVLSPDSSQIVGDVCYNCHAGSSTELATTLSLEGTDFTAARTALTIAADKKGLCFFRTNYPYIFNPRYSSGKVALTNGSPIVTGISTTFTTAGIVTGTTTTSDQFRAAVDGSTQYSVKSVDSDTQITLAKNYSGPTTSTNSAYVIFPTDQGSAVTNWLNGGTEANGRNYMGAALNLQHLRHDPGAYIHNRTYVKRLIYDTIDWLDDGALNYSVGATLNALPAETSYKTSAMRYLLPNGVLTGVSAERP